jgi:hypothetical protein
MVGTMGFPKKAPTWLIYKIKGQMKRRRRLQEAINRAIEADKAREALVLSRELGQLVDQIGVDVHTALQIDGSSLAAGGPVAYRREVMEKLGLLAGEDG